MADLDLELKQITKIYPGGTLAVEAFDLEVSRGNSCHLLGHLLWKNYDPKNDRRP